MKKKSVVSLERKIFPYLLIAPNTMIFCAFVIIPAFCGLWYSMTKWTGIGEPVFIGLDNYVKAFRDVKFWEALKRTGIYAVLCLPVVIATSLSLAILMVQAIPGKGIFRAMIYWPSMVSAIVVGVAFRFIFGDSTGIINHLLSLVGIDGVGWLMEAKLATAVTILAQVWSCAGYYMIMFMAGLNNIPLSYYEAAKVDGASAVQRFRYITLPLIKPTMFLVLILGLLRMFKAYGMIVALTDGGPGTSTKYVVQYIFENAFEAFNMGYASTLSIILMVVIGILTCIQFVFSKGGAVDE